MQTVIKHESYTIDIPDYGTHLDIDTLIDIVKRSGSHFFDKETMRFFRSRVYDYTYAAPDGWYFVTSEKHESAFARINEPRMYTVRQMRLRMRDDKLGLTVWLVELENFQHYATLTRARTAARNAAKTAHALCSMCHLRISEDVSRTVCVECEDRETRRQERIQQ